MAIITHVNVCNTVNEIYCCLRNKIVKLDDAAERSSIAMAVKCSQVMPSGLRTWCFLCMGRYASRKQSACGPRSSPGV